MKRIVVSGSTSMIGRALIEVALENRIEVYALVRPNTKRKDRMLSSAFVHYIPVDLDSLDAILDLPRDCDVFYHFAWKGTSKEERNNRCIQKENIIYTLNAVELAHKCGCGKFVGAGSQAEYGHVRGIIDDETMCKPLTPYGKAKFEAGIKSRIRCEKYGMIHIWGRIFSVYGKNDNEGTMINYAIDCFLKREKAKFSSCKQIWNYLNERDAGEIFFLIGEKIEWSSIYRIAGEENLPLRCYIEIITNIMKSQDLCEFTTVSETNGEQYGINTFDEKLYIDIDYRPMIRFEEGIREIIEKKYRDNTNNNERQR